MQNQAVIEYIKKAREAGMADGEIKNILYKNGWTEQDVNENMQVVSADPLVEQKPSTNVTIQRPVQTQQQPAQTSQPAEASQAKPFSAQTQARPQQKPATVTPSQRKKSPILIFLAVLAVFLIIGAGSFAYVLWSRVYDPAWSPFRPSPEEILGYMFANMQNVKTFDAQMQGEINFLDNDGKAAAKIVFSADNKNDLSDPAGQKMDFKFKAQLTVSGTVQANAEGKAIIIGSLVYIKPEKISSGVLTGLDTSKILGKWFTVDQGSVSQMGAEFGLAQDTLASLQTAMPQQIDAKIKNLLFFRSALSFVKDLGDKDGRYHYLAKTNMDKAGDIDIEIQIDKKDNMLYSYKINKIIPNQLIVKLEAGVSNFNEPAAISRPEEIESKIEQAFLPAIREQRIKADLAQLAGLAQAIFSGQNSYAPLCYKGVLNGYEKTVGANLIGLNNSLMTKGAKKPVCFSSAADFCISTQLENGAFLCAGKTAGAGTTKCVSAATQCQ